MNRETIACAMLACALAGCGGAERPSVLDARASAQLRAVLSKEPQLPDGFTNRPDQAWQMPFRQADRNCRAVLDPAGGRAPGQELTAQAAVTYRGDGLGEQAGVGLARYAGDAAEDRLDDLAEALESCRVVRGSDGTDLRPQELEIEGDWDEAVAARLQGRLNGYPYTVDVVLSRVDDTLVSVVHTGMDAVDTARTRAVVEAVISLATA
ncbi:hypothetical protein [Nonomuraea jiangxiensis]|uniref:PknH-like extracellular domain-containing protein n=1 Tax=Nonomuraea jiangxiensis TaxID=633440 RepID=A0A1G7YIN3_9ACTN|nr:hypothetical protein [Nonomuraea jiangxiensis]SDG96166.1 hypothetical protein SAMN05421869_101125 [Nonomuraea jiangxiensis]